MFPSHHRAALAAVLALVVACAAPAIAAAPPSTNAKTRELNPGLDRMLERKVELGLSPDQESRLTQIRKDLAEKNRPPREQVEAKIGDRPSKEQMKAMSESEREDFVLARQAEGRSHPELQPVYKQMRENRKVAWQEAKTVLHPDQQAKVEKWAKEKQAEMKAKGKSQGKSKSKDASSNAIPSTDAGEPVNQGK